LLSEKLSGRAPEDRGNGLKFVRKSVANERLHLLFCSGSAKAELNDKLEINKTEPYIRGCLAQLTFQKDAN